MEKGSWNLHSAVRLMEWRLPESLFLLEFGEFLCARLAVQLPELLQKFRAADRVLFLTCGLIFLLDFGEFHFHCAVFRRDFFKGTGKRIKFRMVQFRIPVEALQRVEDGGRLF